MVAAIRVEGEFWPPDLPVFGNTDKSPSLFVWICIAVSFLFQRSEQRTFGYLTLRDDRHRQWASHLDGTVPNRLSGLPIGHVL